MVGPVDNKPSGVADHVRNMIIDNIRGVWTICPGVITTVNSNMTVNVKIKVERVNDPYMQITNVPVVFPRGGDSFIIMPLKIGDVVLVGFSKFQMDNLLVNQQVVQRNIDREEYFEPWNAIVIGGFILEYEKGMDLFGQPLEIPLEDMIIVSSGNVKMGKVLMLLDGVTDPTSPQNGMIWRKGNKLYAHSNDVTFELGAGGSTSDMGKVLDKINSTISYASGETDVYQYVAGSNVLRRLVGEVKVVGIFTVGRTITVRAWSKIDDTNWSLKDFVSFTLTTGSVNPHVDITSQKTMKITLEAYPAESKTVNYSAEVTQMEQ